MPQFQAYSASVMVNGQTVLSVVDGMGAFKDEALLILDRHGVKQPQASGWYPQQAWLKAFEEIYKRIGVNTLYRIGLSIPKNAKFPPGIDSVEKALATIDVAYHMNHRGGEIGRYAYEKTGERQGVMVCRNPYPCDFDRGLVEAVAERFKPKGAFVKVRHDASKPCRKQSGDSCTYAISW